MQNITQYASFLVAVGCTLEYSTETSKLDVRSLPSEDSRQEAIKAALEDIAKFDDTANFTDGAAAFHLAEFVDGEPNPLSYDKRVNALNALGIMYEEQFIFSVMMSARSNRSWHKSEKANSCTAFGTICTHRGTVIVPNKRGIRSNRKPHEYHPQSGTTIKREQLVTPALERAYSMIPDKMLTSGKTKSVTHEIEQHLETLKPEELDEFINKLTAMKEKVNANG